MLNSVMMSLATRARMADRAFGEVASLITTWTSRSTGSILMLKAMGKYPVELELALVIRFLANESYRFKGTARPDHSLKPRVR